MATPADRAGTLPPTWLLGLANAPLGIAGGLALLSLPQLLAAKGVPEPTIAGITSLGLLASTSAFLLGPLLDVWLSRRTYAVIATAISAVAAMAALLLIDHLAALTAAVVVMMLFSAVNNVAIGGWFGSLEDKEADAGLGAWMNVANVAGFGLIAMAAIPVVRGASAPVAAAILGAPLLAPLAIYAVTPGRAAGRGQARESFGRFFADLVRLARRPAVPRLLLLFAAPAASFALTNTLGGLGRDYRASEVFVGLMGGAAATLAGVVGSLSIPRLARRASGLPLYLAIGSGGALFTLSLIFLPRTPALFAIAMIGENIAQSAALALVNVLALRSLGEDNPLAATQFGVLTCASNLPITYMQWFDGQAYGAGGLPLMFLADGGLGLGACCLLALALRAWRPRPPSIEG